MVIVPTYGFMEKRKPKPTAAPAFALIAATYTPGESVTLTFNQPVDSAAIEPSGFNVEDAVYTNNLLMGIFYTQPSPNVIEIGLEMQESTGGTGVTLYIDATNGIRTMSGVEWAGVSGLVLPFQ